MRPNESDADRDFITSLARGLEVLQACGRGDRGMALSEVAEAVGLPRATVRRCLLTFVSLGYMSTDDRRFRLTPKVLSLAASYLGSTPIPRVVQPFLEEISRELDESSSAAVLDGWEIVYVARAQTRRIISEELGVGSRLPAFSTAMGRVLLAAFPAEEVEKELRRSPPPSHTDRTITEPAALLEILRSVRHDGYCLVDQELELGLRSIAVPLAAASGATIAALNVGAHASRVKPQEMRERFLPALRRTAAELQPLLVL